MVSQLTYPPVDLLFSFEPHAVPGWFDTKNMSMTLLHNVYQLNDTPSWCANFE